MQQVSAEATSRGRVVRVEEDGGTVVFHPENTNYQHHLTTDGGRYAGPVDRPVRGVVVCKARKLYSVPSGGAFVVPTLGVPKIVQGRVVSLTERAVIVKAGATFIVELPADSSAIDLNHGPVAVGSLVNVVCQPGAAFGMTSAAGRAGPTGQPVVGPLDSDATTNAVR